MLANQDSDDVYDVFLKVPSNGIHSPWNLHSFAPHLNFVPFMKCAMCQDFIYPFTPGAYCVRCGCTAHRSCCNRDTNVCHNFLLGPQNFARRGSLLSRTFWGTASPRHSPRKEVTQVAPLVVDKAKKLQVAIGLNDLNSPLPIPGSEHCIWRKALRHISSGQTLTRMSSIPPHIFAIENVAKSMLFDAKSFPGTVLLQLRELYMALRFDDALCAIRHAREALDNIVCGVLALLPEDVAQDADKLKHIINIVDKRALGLNDGSMYQKVFAAAKTGVYAKDAAFMTVIEESRPEVEQPIDYDDSWKQRDVVRVLCQIPRECTAQDKLRRLIEVLKLIASVAFSQPSSPASSSATATAHHDILQDFEVNADVLISKFIDLLIDQARVAPFFWNAEVIFIDMMCRESSWLLGAEGYAIVTLQQALLAICPASKIQQMEDECAKNRDTVDNNSASLMCETE